MWLGQIGDRMRSKAALLLAMSLLLSASTVAAAAIYGTLTPRSGGPAKPANAGRSGITDAVIYVELLPEAVERKLNSRGFWIFRRPAPPRVRSVVQMNRKFDPHVLATAVGDRVAFNNLDRVYHSTFSVSPAKRFDLGKRLPGQRDTLILEQPGVINLHCDIHPDMVAYVVVTPNHAFTFPDDTGRYRLPALPPGTYTVRVFHPRWGEIQRRAEISKHGDTRLDLSF